MQCWQKQRETLRPNVILCTIETKVTQDMMQSIHRPTATATFKHRAK